MGKKKVKLESNRIDTTPEASRDINLIDKIIKMYPDLKNDRSAIIEQLVSNKDNSDNKIVVEKFNYMDRVLYKTKAGGVMDEKLNLVGTYRINNNKYEYYIFDEDNLVKLVL